MTAIALAAAGRDPTALVGGRVCAWEGNLLAGGDRLYVVEADEYDRSFLALSPTVAVVTNIEADHLDIYADLADIQRAFAQFVRGARVDRAVRRRRRRERVSPTPSTTEVIRYGITSRDARLVARRIESHARRVELRRRLRRRAARPRRSWASRVSTTFSTRSPRVGSGSRARRRVRRNWRAGWARSPAWSVASSGSAKRGGVLVVDDYAHHPTEIAATLAAARERLSGAANRHRVSAAPLHAHARLRARVRAVARRGRRRLSHRDLSGARAADRRRDVRPHRRRVDRRRRARLAWRGTREELAGRSGGAGRRGRRRAHRRRRRRHEGRARRCSSELRTSARRGTLDDARTKLAIGRSRRPSSCSGPRRSWGPLDSAPHVVLSRAARRDRRRALFGAE